uniref:Uncharacterized protein n=1 Tax=Arundo donax TaxID=35708 RepID=A0A0A8YP90_ARUDO
MINSKFILHFISEYEYGILLFTLVAQTNGMTQQLLSLQIKYSCEII